MSNFQLLFFQNKQHHNKSYERIKMDKSLRAARDVPDYSSSGCELARSHTFLEIDHEIISKVNFLPSADSRIQAKVCARSTG